MLTTLNTFYERLGELRSEDMQDGFHAWMRGIGKTGSYSPKSITGYNGHGFDMTTAGVQIGGDYSKGDVFVAGDKLRVGIFGEYANWSFDVRGRTADGSISSKGLGGYVTWQQKAPTDREPGTGAYLDAVVKQDWLDFGVKASLYRVLICEMAIRARQPPRLLKQAMALILATMLCCSHRLS